MYPWFTQPGWTVLDPFAGSGTTGQVAKDMGRKAVLVEIEERYCELAAKRMAQAVFDLDKTIPSKEGPGAYLGEALISSGRNEVV